MEVQCSTRATVVPLFATALVIGAMRLAAIRSSVS